MTLALLILWAAAAGLIWLSLLTLPRWFVRSMARHRLWTYRDLIVDEILDGRLPPHPTVWEVLRDVEMSIAYAHQQSLLRTLSARRSIRHLSPEARDRWLYRCRQPSTDGLTTEQVALVQEHREHVTLLTTGLLMLGSWIGVLTVLWRVPAAIRTVQRERSTASTTVARATDQAVTNTKLGQAVSEAVASGAGMGQGELAHA